MKILIEVFWNIFFGTHKSVEGCDSRSTLTGDLAHLFTSDGWKHII